MSAHRPLATRPVVPATSIIFAALLGACADDMPRPSQIDDLRVLAISAEPPELLIDRDAPGALAPVTFQALVVDPRGMPMSFEWSFCPVESDQTCGDFAPARARAPEFLRPMLDAARAQMSQGQAPPDQAAGNAPLTGFAVQVPLELFSYHLGASGLGLGNGAWTSAVLAVGSAGDTLLAQKRLTLNARDLSQWNPELAAAGWQVCPPPGQSGPAGCLPLRPRTANRNPVIAGVEMARGKSANLPFQPLPAELEVAPGETIRLRPVLAAEAIESYQSIESTLMGSQLVVVKRQEEPIVSWFATSGEFDQDQTAPQLTRTLDVQWEAPDRAPADGKVPFFIVVRDQRGGLGWTSLTLTVADRPAPAPQ